MSTDALSDLDALLADAPLAAPTFAGATGRKCGRHQWVIDPADAGAAIVPQSLRSQFGLPPLRVVCSRCGVIRDEARAKRGRQSRNYGNRAELKAARRYGGEKIGAAGGPVDIRGKDWNVQVKTHRRLPPLEWRKAFSAMEASGERLPRLLLRFVQGPGLPPVDYFVIPGDVWLDWFGKDDAA